MFKLQSLSKYSPFDAVHLFRHFSPQLKMVFERVHFMPFSASAIFCFVSSTLAKHFPLRIFIIRGKNNKESSLSGSDWVNREGGTWGSCRFRSKTAEHSAGWAGALVNHPSWNGQTCRKSLWKNSLKLNTASHNHASWYTDTDGSLEHSPSRGSLYLQWTPPSRR